MSKNPQINPVLDVLLKAREHISDPNRWCQGDMQRGEKVCLVGALKRGAGLSVDSWSVKMLSAATSIRKVLTQGYGARFLTIPDFNDASTHAEVLEVLDKAIANEIQ